MVIFNGILDEEIHDIVSEDILSLNPFLMLNTVNSSPMCLLALKGSTKAKCVVNVERLGLHGDGLHVIIPEVKERSPPGLDNFVIRRAKEVKKFVFLVSL